MDYSRPVTEIIPQRFSCRTYLETPIAPKKRRRLQQAMDSLQAGPLGTPLRFSLLAATAEDRSALQGLAAYGSVKGESGFIAGAVQPGAKNLEDYGYALEMIILLATDLGLGTCWIGGIFTRGRFARKIALARGEQMPAVAAIGDMADPERARIGLTRRLVGADRRLPWADLFFAGRFGAPLSREAAGPYATPLEMLRLGPSASNKQPWRVIRDGNAWHFYLHRTRGYYSLGSRLAGIADIQRVDMGIAMCHFALTAGELGLSGRWAVQEPDLQLPDAQTEYTVSWLS